MGWNEDFIARFIAAIRARRKVRIQYLGPIGLLDDGLREKTAVASPLDVKPDEHGRLLLVVHERDEDGHEFTYQIAPDSVVEVTMLDETFEPADVIGDVDPPFIVPRDW